MERIISADSHVTILQRDVLDRLPTKHHDAYREGKLRALRKFVGEHVTSVPDDDQVRDRELLVKVRHPVAGHWVQVGVPVRLSTDMPAVRGPAPNPGRARRRTATAP